MKHFFYKGKDDLLLAKDSEPLEDKIKIVKKEFSKLLESRNLSFLMGSGCSLGDNGIPTMIKLAAGFFEPEEKVLAAMSATLKGLVLSNESKTLLGAYKIKYNEEPFIKNLETFLGTLYSLRFYLEQINDEVELGKIDKVINETKHFILYQCLNKDNENETEKINVDDVDGTKLNLLDIGTSTIFPDYKVKIDINSFFGAHSAILGNTGSGKSCTISSMMQSLLQKEGFSAVGASFIFFDVNGEYHKAFCQIKNPDIEIKYLSLNTIKDKTCFNYSEGFDVCDNIYYEEFKLPHWFLNIEEWALLLQASDRTQLPILRNAINLIKLFAGNAGNLNKVKNHILYLCLLHILRDESSPPSKKDRIIAILSKFHTAEISLSVSVSQGLTLRDSLHINYGNMLQMESLIGYLEREGADGTKEFYLENFNIPTGNEVIIKTEFDEIENALDLSILFEEAHGNSQIRDYCSSLLTRYKSLKERSEFNFMTSVKEDVDKVKYIDEILGIAENKTKKTQISIIDLNSVEDEIVEVISCVISRLIFEKLKNAEHRNTFPVNIVLEEAHRYISNDPGSVFGSANKIFERIAKEGRKYGMFLLASSQRPSELSRTVLSQCSNFIIHRIQNPEDLSQIRQMTPHISASILSRLPSIPRQHALVFGHAVQIPTLFKVNDANPTPHSNDNDVTKNWFIPKPAFVQQEAE